MTYSYADERAKTPPPEPCLHCTHVQIWLCHQEVTRYRCGKDLHMQTPCMAHTPLPDGRTAQPTWSTS